MNITAKIKSARDPSKYVINFSIDIPLNPKYALSHRSNDLSLASPSRPNRKPKLTNKHPNNRRTLNSNYFHNDALKTLNAKKKSNASTTFSGTQNTKAQHNKYRSCEISPAPPRFNKNFNSQHITHLCCDNRPIRNPKNLSLLPDQPLTQRFSNLEELSRMHSEDDNLIKYTINSSELKQDAVQRRISESPELEPQEIDLGEMRVLQNLARERKQHLNYLYLKEKVLVLASVKKIQRAWRNYRTKQIVRSYSSNISLKLTNKMKSTFQNNKLTVRSQQSFRRKPDTVVPKVEAEKSGGEVVFMDKSKIETKLRAFQKEEIKKWDELAEEIRAGKNIEKLLFKSCEWREQINRQLHSTHPDSRQQPAHPDDPHQPAHRDGLEPTHLTARQTTLILAKETVESQNREAYVSSKEATQVFISQQQLIPKQVSKQISKKEPCYIQKNQRSQILQKQYCLPQVQPVETKFLQQQMQRIDNEVSDKSSNSDEAERLKGSDENRKEDIQNIKLKKKLQLFNKLDLLGFRQDHKLRKEGQKAKQQLEVNYENPNEEKQNGVLQPKSMLAAQQDDELAQSIEELPENIAKNSNSKIYKENQEQKAALKKAIALENKKQESSLQTRLKQLSVMERLDLSQKLSQQLVYEILLDFSESSKIVEAFGKLQEVGRREQPEGICTNLESIKDYLQNLVSYIFESYHEIINKGLDTHSGPDAARLLKYFRKEQEDESDSGKCEYVLDVGVFDAHWKYASDHIYFDPKYKRPEEQKERVKYLKGLTKVYFRSIYDAFVESLEFHRAYGLTGKPFPWVKSLRKAERLPLQKIFQLTYKRIMNLSVVFCGVHFADKKHNMLEGTINEIKEQRLNNLIEMEVAQDQYRWHFFDDDDAEVRYLLSELIQTQLWQEATQQFQLSTF